MSRRRDRGQALIIAFMVLLVLGIVGMAGSVQAVHEGIMARRYMAEARAFWIAEAGLQKAYWEITQNDCHGMKQAGDPEMCRRCNDCGMGNKVLTGKLDVGSYTVTVDPGFKEMTSEGSCGPDLRAPVSVRRVQADLGAVALFGFAAFSKGEIELSNNALVDSYDSSKGKYGGANIGDLGNIGTNSTAAGSVKLMNTAKIKGNVTTGQGGTVEKSMNAMITGEIKDTNSITLPQVVVPYDLESLDSMGSLDILSNQTKTLGAGSYKYGIIRMENNGKLVIDGDVKMRLTEDPSLLAGSNNQLIVKDGASLKIYVDGKVAFEDNIAVNNLSAKPGSFTIYSTYTGSKGVVIANHDDFKGVVYAPGTDVVVTNNASMSGAIVGKTVTVSNNGQIHYDQALGGYVDKNAPPILHHWREVQKQVSGQP